MWQPCCGNWNDTLLNASMRCNSISIAKTTNGQSVFRFKLKLQTRIPNSDLQPKARRGWQNINKRWRYRSQQGLTPMVSHWCHAIMRLIPSHLIDVFPLAPTGAQQHNVVQKCCPCVSYATYCLNHCFQATVAMPFVLPRAQQRDTCT